jgi:hypothetical protein
VRKKMRLTRSICGAPAAVIVLVVVACIGLSSWGLTAYTVPALGRYLETAATKYDSLLPEITIRNGQASIREKQPYIVEGLGDKDLLVMVDTREGRDPEILDRLKTVPVAAILTRDNIVFKNRQEVRWFPLKDMPDMVINSTHIEDFVRDYLPRVTRWIIISIILYFLFAKPLQILLLALIPYLAARSYSLELSYGQSLKLASVALIVPVVLEFVLDMAGIHIPAQLALYFALYIALLWLAVRDLAHSPEVSEGSAADGGNW